MASKPRYPLAQLLELRETEEKERERALAAAIAKSQAHAQRVEAAQNLVEEKKERVVRSQSAASRASDQGARVEMLVQRHAFTAARRAELEHAILSLKELRSKLRRLHEEEASCRQALADAVRERKALETHHARWQRENAVSDDD